MRIIAGNFRGRKLPELKEEGVRPTLDRVRENLFNILSSQIKDSVVLDLFAGSGAIGFEALSRGASEVVFCEKSPKISTYIKKVAEILAVKPSVLVSDYKSALNRLNGKRFDIIYLDPPYNFDGNEVLKAVYDAGVLDEDTVIVYERQSDKPFSLSVDGLSVFDERKYGIATLIFLRKNNE